MKILWIERLVLVAAVGVAWFAWSAKQHAERETIIALENAYAAGDTIRVLRDAKAADSAAFTVSLRQQDVALRGLAGRLARSEGLAARLHADLAVATRAVDTTLVGAAPVVADSAGRLVDSIEVTGPPISGTITAALSPFERSRWDLRLQPDPIPLTVVVGCRKGLPPSILVTAPDWATVTPSGVLDPAICHPKPRRGWLMPLLIGVGVGILSWETIR